MIREERGGHITESLVSREEDFGFDFEWDGSTERFREGETQLIPYHCSWTGVLLGWWWWNNEAISDDHKVQDHLFRKFLVGWLRCPYQRYIHYDFKVCVLPIVVGPDGLTIPIPWPLPYHWPLRPDLIPPILSLIPLSLKSVFSVSRPSLTPTPFCKLELQTETLIWLWVGLYRCKFLCVVPCSWRMRP